MGPVERRLAELVRLDMRRAGVELGPAERERARDLRATLTKLAQDHARNIRDDTRHVPLESDRELAGLPEDYRSAHRPDADGVIRISTNPPDMQPFMTYAHSGRARLELHRASADRAPANVDVKWTERGAIFRVQLAEAKPSLWRRILPPIGITASMPNRFSNIWMRR